MREILLTSNGKNAKKDDDFGYIKVEKDGTDELSVILNYPFKMIYRVNDGDTIGRLNAKGFECEDELVQGKYVVLKKVYNTYHVVKPCETLSSIAQKHNISESELIKNNNLKTNKVFIGQTLSL